MISFSSFLLLLPMATLAQKIFNLRGGFHAPHITTNWLSDYVHFHRQERHMSDYLSKYLVLDYDDSHGGSLERNLLSIPYYLWLASKFNRVFVLGDTWKFDENCGLDEFWKPNHLDWTMPPLTKGVVELYPATENDYYNHFVSDVNLQQEDQARIIRVKGNPMSLLIGLGQVFQDTPQDEDGHHHRQIYKEIFQIMFQLQDPLQQMLNDVTQDLDLTNNEYIAVHLDAPVNVLKNVQKKEQLYKTSENDYAKKAYFEEHMNFERVVQRTKLLNGGTDNNVLLYCAGIDRTNSLDECVNDNGQLQSYAKHIDEQDSCAARFYPQIVDLYLTSQASCIGFGDDDTGLAATLFSDFDCYSVHDMNPTIMNAAQRWDSPFYPNPSGRQREMKPTLSEHSATATI